MTGVAHEDMKIFENHEAAIGRCESLKQDAGNAQGGRVPQKTGIATVKVERGSVSANAAAYHVNDGKGFKRPAFM